MKHIRFAKRIRPIVLVTAVTIISMGLSFLSPLFAQTANAATVDSVVNLPDARTASTSNGQTVNSYSCQAAFVAPVPASLASGSPLSRALNAVSGFSITNTSDLNYLSSSSQSGGNSPPLTADQVTYLTNAVNAGTALPYIHFVGDTTGGATSPVNNPGGPAAVPTAAEDAAVCNQYVMIPVPTDGNATGCSTGSWGEDNLADSTYNPGGKECEWITIVGTSNAGGGFGKTSMLIFAGPTGIITAGGATEGYFKWAFNNVGYCGGPSANGEQGCVFPKSTAQGGNNNIAGSNGAFIVGGTPSFTQPPAGTGVNSISVVWNNADQFTILAPSQYAGDVYQDPTWGNTPAPGISFYFLYANAHSDNVPTMNSGQWCSDPLANGFSTTPETSGCTTQGNGTTNCVPFFGVNANFDVQGSTAQLQTQFNKLSLYATEMQFYNYNSSCAASPVVTSGNITRTFGNGVETSAGPMAAPQIWLYYVGPQPAAANATFSDEYVTVMTEPTSAGNNESNYIGEYTKATGNTYSGPTGQCAAQVTSSAAPPTTVGSSFAVTWNLYPPGSTCTASGSPEWAPIVLANTVSEATFSTIAGIVGNNSANNTSTSGPNLACDIISLDPLNWVICPIADAAEHAAGWLDNVINDLLVINTSSTSADSIFNTQAGTDGYHQAWYTFRTFALGLIVIAALFMVIAQAAGVEFLDAYTIRKVLPRLLIASIGITLSWPLLQFVVGLSNAMGSGVISLIYAPFTSLKGNLQGGSNFVLLLIGGGAVVAFGWLALLSFLLTALMAVLVGVGVLIFRQVLLTFLVIVSPIAIACYILPHTHKAWRMWYDSMMGVLLSFVIISAFIATGRVFSASALAQAGGTGIGVVFQLIAVVAYFAPYFLIPLAFRIAGGFLETAGGFVNDRSRGAFDRVKKFRSNAVKKNVSDMGSGGRFSNNNALGRNFNNLTAGTAAFAGSDDKMGFLRNAHARETAIAMQRETGAHHFADSKQGKFLQYNDAANQASLYRNEDEARAGLARDFNMTDQHQIDGAIAAVRGTGGWNQQRSLTAFRRLAESGTGFSDIGQLTQAADIASGGNADLRRAIIGAARPASGAAGRVGLAASGFGTQDRIAEAWGELRQAQARGEDVTARRQAIQGMVHDANLEAFASTDATTLLRAKPNDLKTVMASLPHAIAHLQQVAADPTSSADESRRARDMLGKTLGGLGTVQAFRSYGAPVNAATVYDAVNGTGMSDTPDPNSAMYQYNQQGALAAQAQQLAAVIQAVPGGYIAQGQAATLGGPAAGVQP